LGQYAGVNLSGLQENRDPASVGPALAFRITALMPNTAHLADTAAPVARRD
jgi:hypothetical protein